MDHAHIALAATVMLATALTAVLLCLVKTRSNAVLLKKQLDSAIEANIRRTGFFSNMVHELKMPLSVILGAAQLIEMKLTSERQDEKAADGAAFLKTNCTVPQSDYMQKNIAAIKCNCYRMMKLTGNLLDLAKSEAGYLKLKPVNCDLCILLEEIVHSVQPYAVKKQLDLQFRKPQDKLVVAVDAEKAERIMLNLLSNAIKFTNPGGSIIVSAYTADGLVFISVKDTGVGIPAEKQNEIFGLYSQAGLHSCAEKEGHGIGLYLVKTFVELHQGNIKLFSEEGRGSEFIIDLPARTVEPSREALNAGDNEFTATYGQELTADSSQGVRAAIGRDFTAGDAANMEFSGE